MRAPFFVISFVVIAAFILPSCPYRILGVFSYNGKSHFTMYEALLRGLAKRGHQVDVVSHFPPENPFRNYNQIVNLAGPIPSLMNNLTYKSIKTIMKSSLAHLTATTYGGDLCQLMDRSEFKQLIKNPPRDPPYDLLITDILGATCYLALGQHFNVPVVGTVSGVPWPWINDMVANPEDPAYIPNLFSGFDGKMNFWQRLSNVLQLTYEKWEFRYYSAHQDGHIQKYIGPHAPGVREAERNVSLIFVNSHYSINGVRPYTQAVVEVGGLHIPESLEPLPNDLEKWLNESKHGFVYISFGTLFKIESLPEEILFPLYASIKELSPIRVLMKVPNPEELPPGLPSNVLTLKWIPQLAILNHKNIRAFMTHGGQMGIMEAIWYGVPMVGLPFLGDQTKNIKLFVTKHVAVYLDHKQLTKENLNAAFNSVLNDPSYTQAVKKLSTQFRDRPMSPMDTAVFWVEYVIRHGGANLRSPAMDLTWWQISMLDVYAVLFLAAIFIVCLLIFIIHKLITAIAKTFNSFSVPNQYDKKIE